MVKEIAVLWQTSPGQGSVRAAHGTLLAGHFEDSGGELVEGRFSHQTAGPCRLELSVDAKHLERGAESTRVSVQAEPGSFSFFLRDVRREFPILVPPYQVAVTVGDDRRSYSDIEAEIRGRGLLTELQRIEREPEESYGEAAQHTRALELSTLLGVSRDIRIFCAGMRGMDRCQINADDDGTHGALEEFDWIQPLFHGYDVPLEGREARSGYFTFLVGRGWGCTHAVSRRLEEGALPVLKTRVADDDVRYDGTLFVTLETSGLAAGSVRGTHWLVADRFSPGHVFTAEQEQASESLLAAEMNEAEETVACFRVVASNTADVPRYAFFKGLSPAAELGVEVPPHSFDPQHGWSVWEETGRVFGVSRLDGAPLSQEETAVLLAPGETASFEFFLPHRPVSRERALRLSRLDFAARLHECRAFWRQKLAGGGRIEVPEERIDEQVRASALHLDLILYGLEPDGPLAPTVGPYPAFGTESAPIIRFLDSMGRHDLARRSLQFFLEKQHPDGFMRNYGSIDIETGAVLWLLGEHYRHTRDDEWVARIALKVVRSCEYIVGHLRQNRREELRGKGFGMLPGPVGDDADSGRHYVTSGYAYLGLSRAAEMLARTDPGHSDRLAAEAEVLKQDIRTALAEALASGPVVPLGDGNWCPTAGAWPGSAGPLCLFAEGGNWYSHMSFTHRDAVHGPMRLVFQEVLAPHEEMASFLLSYHTELMYTRNTGFSMPYFSRHDFAHLKRGEVPAFLKDYYNSLSSMVDRQTYTFTEHFWPAYKAHKTHQAAGFLMQTRWMLYIEEGDTLRLLPGIPRAWLERGKRIRLDEVASYFGPLSLQVESRLDQGRIEARVTCASEHRPSRVEVRLPHPRGRKAVSVQGGTYDPGREAVRVDGFGGRADIVLEFGT